MWGDDDIGLIVTIIAAGFGAIILGGYIDEKIGRISKPGERGTRRWLWRPLRFALIYGGLGAIMVLSLTMLPLLFSGKGEFGCLKHLDC